MLAIFEEYNQCLKRPGQNFQDLGPNTLASILASKLNEVNGVINSLSDSLSVTDSVVPLSGSEKYLLQGNAQI